MITSLQDFLRHFRAVRARRTPEEVFSRIYRTNRWGGAPGEFFSGEGTRLPEIRDPYVRALESLAEELGFSDLTAVDLGCGDFEVGRHVAGLFGSYIGVDVVPDLIEHNQATFGSDTVRFTHADLTAEALPAGEVCLVRQVFQHLSNAQIARALPKLEAFDHVVVTEHIPTDPAPGSMNADHVHGTSIRLIRGSGVDLALPPFGVEPSTAAILVDVPVPDRRGGMLRTTLYSPLRLERVSA